MKQRTVFPTRKRRETVNNRSPFRYRAGFTLIELLVGITIMLLLLGGGIASFVNFNDRQTLVGAGKEFQTYLRSAQTKARVGDRPDTCPRLLSYAVSAGQGTNQVQVVARCEVGGIDTPQIRNTYTFPPNIILNANVDIRFGVLSGGVTNPGDVVLRSTTTDQTYTITVTQGGEIRDGVLGN